MTPIEKEITLPALKDIPKIPLYMDQLLEFIHSELGEVTYTKTMINNYVKAGIIDAPLKKKYSQNAIIQLLMMHHLKNAFSISESALILKALEGQYEVFTAIFEKKKPILNELNFLQRPDKRALIEHIVDISLKKQVVNLMITASSE